MRKKNKWKTTGQSKITTQSNSTLKHQLIERKNDIWPLFARADSGSCLSWSRGSHWASRLKVSAAISIIVSCTRSGTCWPVGATASVLSSSSACCKIVWLVSAVGPRRLIKAISRRLRSSIHVTAVLRIVTVIIAIKSVATARAFSWRQAITSSIAAILEFNKELVQFQILNVFLYHMLHYTKSIIIFTVYPLRVELLPLYPASLVELDENLDVPAVLPVPAFPDPDCWRRLKPLAGRLL